MPLQARAFAAERCWFEDVVVGSRLKCTLALRSRMRIVIDFSRSPLAQFQSDLLFLEAYSVRARTAKSDVACMMSGRCARHLWIAIHIAYVQDLFRDSEGPGTQRQQFEGELGP